MEMTDVISAVREVFAGIFDVEADELKSNASPDSLANWDSLSHLKLVNALEERFDIEIDPEDQIDMLTFELVCDIIHSRMSVN